MPPPKLRLRASTARERESCALARLSEAQFEAERRLVMGRHEVPWLNASTAAASNLEELAYHYGTDKSHDDHKCRQLLPQNSPSARTHTA